MIHYSSYLTSKMQYLAQNSNYRSRILNSAHHSQKSQLLKCRVTQKSSRNYCISSHRICHKDIVYCRMESIAWISSIATQNLSRGYYLSSHRYCLLSHCYCLLSHQCCHMFIIAQCDLQGHRTCVRWWMYAYVFDGGCTQVANGGCTYMCWMVDMCA